MDISFRWNRGDSIDPSAERPHMVAVYDGLVVLRGEEDENLLDPDIYLSSGLLTCKMHKWSSLFHGNLPYTLGYVASNAQLKIYAIDRHLGTATVVEFYSIVADKADVIKVLQLVVLLQGHGHSTQTSAFVSTRAVRAVCKRHVHDRVDGRRDQANKTLVAGRACRSACRYLHEITGNRATDEGEGSSSDCPQDGTSVEGCRRVSGASRVYKTPQPSTK